MARRATKPSAPITVATLAVKVAEEMRRFLVRDPKRVHITSAQFTYGM